MSDIEGALNGSTLINSTSKALGAEDILKKALELSKNKTEDIKAEDNNDIIGNK